MSSATETSAVSSAKSLWKSPVFTAHVVALALHLPLLLVYFRELWSQPHYQSFFVFALGFVAVYIYWRVNEASRIIVSTRGILPNLFLAMALPFSIFANVVFDPDFAAIGCFFLSGSLLGRLRDRATDKSLLPAVWVLATAVRLPFKLDIILITRLQIWTSKLASAFLDLLGINHLLSGNVIKVGEATFGVEEACSGIQSLFLLIFCAIAWSVFAGRSFLRLVLLTLTAIFWAALFNVVRVTTICIAEAWYDVDLANGIQHALLGYCSIGLSILMLVSTDFLLEFFLGNAGLDAARQTSKIWFWKRGGATDSSSADASARPAKRSPSPLRRWLIVASCAVVGLIACFPWYQVGPAAIWRQLTDKYIVRELKSDGLPETFQTQPAETMPAIDWKVEKFTLEERELNSDWGSRSSVWLLEAASGARKFYCSVQCDYPFSGWHELTRCYRGNGWQLDSRENYKPQKHGDWPLTIAKMSLPNGHQSVLMFSLFEESGEPMLPPEGDIVTMNFLQRGINAIRQRLTKDFGPTPQTYQVQIFVAAERRIPDADIQWIAENFADIREIIRQRAAAQMK